METWLLIAGIAASPFLLATLFVVIALISKFFVTLLRVCGMKAPVATMGDAVSVPSIPELNCVQAMLDGPTGQRWTMLPCLSDHIEILKSHLYALFGAYTGCFGAAIEHDCTRGHSRVNHT